MSTSSEKQTSYPDKLTPKMLHVIEIAQETFLQNGFEKTSMDMLAEKAGVARRTLYNQFTSKENVFKAVINNIWKHLNPPKLLTTALDTEESQQQLYLVGMMIARYWSPPIMTDFLRLIIQENERFPYLAKDFYHMSKAPVITNMLQYFDSLEEQGVATFNDKDLAVRQFIGLIMEPLSWLRLIGVGEESTEKRRKQVVEEAVKTFTARYFHDQE